MKVSEKRITYPSKKSEYHLYPLCDIHCGVVFTAEDAIKRKVKEIQEDPFALWIGLGDYAECITPSDPRWDIGIIRDKDHGGWVDLNNVAESQRRWVVKLFDPIKDKCLGLATGNHEDNIRRRNNQDIHLDICRDLGVEPLTYSGFYHLIFERRNSDESNLIKLYYHHGAGGAQTEGGKMNRLVRFMTANRANIYLIGHIHDIATKSLPELSSTNQLKVVNQTRVGAIGGSWFKAYDVNEYPSYAERFGYSPFNVGCPRITIKPHHRLLRVEEPEWPTW